MTLPCSQPGPDETSINKPLTSRSSYRPEIDGLRAFAIIAVIVNHFDSTLLPNGFLGVDIFFVISGFVVTSSLSGKPNTSWKDYLLTFYSKRVKRLIPALVICIVVTAIVSCLVIDVDLVVTLLPVGAASLLGVSNLQLLHQNNNYFGQSAIFNPFTQTWSLGVEEQFYLIFPILLGLCGYSRQRQFRGNRNLILVISVLSFFSLVNYIYLFKANTQAAFYLMPARFWELGAGCIMFLVVTHFSSSFLVRLKTTTAPLCGLFLIGLFLWRGIDQAFATIVTVCLSCLLLWSFSKKGFWVSLLASKIIVQVGLLSYSLYLWHWPILIISRWTVGISKWTSPILLILTIGMAMMSYHLIEKPLRYAQWSKVRFKAIAYGIFAALVSASFLTALSYAPLKGKLYSSRYFPEQYLASLKLSKNYYPCNDAKMASNDLAECFYPSGISPSTSSPRIYFVGDSHTYSLQAMASRLIEEKNAAQIAMVAKGSCLFSSKLVGIKNWSNDSSCIESNRAFLSKVMETGRAGDIVVITNFYAVYFIARPTFDDPLTPVFWGPVSGSKLDKAKALEIYSKELVNISEQLSQKGISLVVQSSLPIWKHKLWECQAHWFRPAASLPETCQLDSGEESQIRLPLLRAFRKAEADSTNLYIYDPFSLFCNQDQCNHFSNNNVPLFRDKNHLNNYGAEYLYDDFLKFLKTHSLL